MLSLAISMTQEQDDTDDYKLPYSSCKRTAKSSMEVGGTSCWILNNLGSSHNGLTNRVHAGCNNSTFFRVPCHDNRGPTHC